MHPLLQFAVDQTQVECQVGIFQEEGHDHGVSVAYAPDPHVPDQEDQVTCYMTQPAQRTAIPLDWTGYGWMRLNRSGKRGIPDFKRHADASHQPPKGFIAYGEHDACLDEQSSMTASKGFWTTCSTGYVEPRRV